MIDPRQFRELVIRPTLQTAGLWSESAEALLLGTALVESRLTYLKQLGEGPALGVYQMEPATHDDLWANYIHHRADLIEAMTATVRHVPWPPPASEMIGNLYYATLMARIHYRRIPTSLPPADDLPALGRYWKRHYNTPLGKGTVEKFLAAWKG